MGCIPSETNHGGNLFKGRVIQSSQPYLLTVGSPNTYTHAQTTQETLMGKGGGRRRTPIFGARVYLCVETDVWKGSAACRTLCHKQGTGRAARLASTGRSRSPVRHRPSPSLEHTQEER